MFNNVDNGYVKQFKSSAMNDNFQTIRTSRPFKTASCKKKL